MGNLRSVQKGFERVGHQAFVTSDPDEIAKADRVVLPGVGAFRDAIAEVRKRNLVEPMKEAIAEGKPFLGICLGMQLLFEVGYEDGTYEGMGVFPGDVVRFDLPSDYKVPHMGWNQLQMHSASPLFKGVGETSHFYFVHSYFVVAKNESDVAATADYGSDFCASVWRDNIFATQFHPEKSQANGLKLLKNFAEF